MNEDLNLKYMKIVDTQIPLSVHNWLCVTLDKALHDLDLTSDRKKEILQLWNLKRVSGTLDHLFAPFCVLLSLAPVRKKKPSGEVEKSYFGAFVKFFSNNTTASFLALQ